MDRHTPNWNKQGMELSKCESHTYSFPQFAVGQIRFCSTVVLSKATATAKDSVKLYELQGITLISPHYGQACTIDTQIMVMAVSVRWFLHAKR